MKLFSKALFVAAAATMAALIGFGGTAQAGTSAQIYADWSGCGTNASVYWANTTNVLWVTDTCADTYGVRVEIWDRNSGYTKAYYWGGGANTQTSFAVFGFPEGTPIGIDVGGSNQGYGAFKTNITAEDRGFGVV